MEEHIHTFYDIIWNQHKSESHGNGTTQYHNIVTSLIHDDFIFRAMEMRSPLYGVQQFLKHICVSSYVCTVKQIVRRKKDDRTMSCANFRVFVQFDTTPCGDTPPGQSTWFGFASFNLASDGKILQVFVVPSDSSQNILVSAPLKTFGLGFTVADGESPLSAVSTPCVVLDVKRLRRNCRRMNDHLSALGLPLRQHVKTAKSVNVAKIACEGLPANMCSGVVVSTLIEAEYFHEHGFNDIVYAVGFDPQQTERAWRLVQKGCNLSVLVDNLSMVEEICARLRHLVASLCEPNGVATEAPPKLGVVIELDVGQHRGGIDPQASELLALGRRISTASPNLELRGVLGHAGHSYNAASWDIVQKIAEAEQKELVAARDRLLEIGLPCSIVSAGSTPTCTGLLGNAQSLQGLTEVRAGVYQFGDLDQVGIGSCRVDDIALTVLATVVGHGKSHLVTNAGGLAISKDLSAQRHGSLAPTGYGWVLGHPDLIVSSVSQEHGLITLFAKDDEGDECDTIVEGRSGISRGVAWMFAAFPVGARLRILPHHACFTAAPYREYIAHDASTDTIELWPKVSGW